MKHSADDAHTKSLQCYSEFLIHAADVEGLCKGIDEDLVTSKYQKIVCLNDLLNSHTELGEWVTIPTTYAGGAKGL